MHTHKHTHLISPTNFKNQGKEKKRNNTHTFTSFREGRKRTTNHATWQRPEDWQKRTRNKRENTYYYYQETRKRKKKERWAASGTKHNKQLSKKNTYSKLQHKHRCHENPYMHPPPPRTHIPHTITRARACTINVTKMWINAIFDYVSVTHRQRWLTLAYGHGHCVAQTSFDFPHHAPLLVSFASPSSLTLPAT